MPARLYDEQFSADVLKMLKKRDVLGQSNPVHFVPLEYNVAAEVEKIEEQFEAERKQNPLLETTLPEAWLTAEITPIVAEVRPNVSISEAVLTVALLRYFRRAVRLNDSPLEEQQLWTTVRPYRAALKSLLLDLSDRRKGIHEILKIPRDVRTIRDVTQDRKPHSRREEILLQGIKGHWTNQHIARELDKHGIKPHSRDFGSYTEMFRMKSQNFYALKSEVKRKYNPLLLKRET